MAAFRPPDWAGVFVPDGSLLESFLRGTVVYFGVLVLFRCILRRQAGGLGLTDVLLVVLVSECVSQALTADTKSVPNGLAALAALLFWSFALDWATDRWPRLNRAVEPPPVELVRDGATRGEALHAQHVTADELMSQLRLNGVDDLAAVKVATLEPDGAVSVVTRDAPAAPHPPSPPADGPPDLREALTRFLAAAGDVRAAVAWHDDRAAAHRRAAAEARAALARHGVRRAGRPAVLAPEPTGAG